MAEAADRGEHPGHRSRRLGAAWLLLCAIVFTTAAISLWLVDAGRGNLAPPYSVQRTDEEGGALLYQLYQRAGIRTRVWDREFTDLREPGLLLLLDPPPGPSLGSSSTGDILPYELDALDRWVQQGNVVALFSGRQNLLYTHLGLWLPREGGERHDSAQAAHQGVLTRNVKSLDLTLAAGFRFEPEAPASRFGLEPGEPTSAPKPLIPRNHWVGLFRFPGASSGSPTAPGKGWPVVAAARGRGLYLAVAEVVPAGNLGLSQADNARFLLNLASLGPARGTIWLDEY
ncbi:MAG: hypothetical protein FJX77_16300, partial [Armatimonadetes bacterium]|nr:hypothetical protein [Armatimonadota bacterium]